MNREYSSASGRLHSPGFKRLGRASVASIGILLILLISASCAFAWPVSNFTVTPENPICRNSGNITITGDVGPGETVTIVTTYVKEVNVTDGEYKYDAGLVPIPAGTTFCSITAERVANMTITTNLFGLMDISHTQDAHNGKATLATTYIPKGTYNLIISGSTAGTDPVTNGNEGTEINRTVNITFVAKMNVTADKNGYFKQVCCTQRPAGNYTLDAMTKVGKKTKIVTLVDCCGNTTNGNSTNVDNSVTGTYISNSGGTGNAALMGVNNSTARNATVLNSLGDAGPEDPADVTGTTEQATVSSVPNGLMGIIKTILNWLGF
ncbi:hypothetical protein [uncultured Methanomethylovorans sp.]|uniref:hypothetical protein n=1 Tax=uncultured Methanomethylovorans sp. TaxID=183759 RepID=UPI002AA89CEB|nr:hypothetical protein [uncultured Methanomethylovorans sp.]